MHDIRMVRERLDELREGMRRRGKLDAVGPLLERAEELEKERRVMIQAVEERKAARNSASQEVAKRKRAGEDASDLMAQARTIGDEISRLERELAAAEQGLTGILLELPNLTLPDVPEGGESANAIVREWGTPRAPEGIRPHWDVASALGVLDLERGAKISGSGFVVFRRNGARLVRALINFMIDMHSRDHGYDETWVPYVVNRATMTGTGQLPKFEDDMYGLSGDDMFLVPTAEVPVTNLYRDEIVDVGALPSAFVAYTPCFRREAGSHGKDTRGLLRLHEFDKVELVRYCEPEQGLAQLELLTSHAEAVLQQLGLPYRVVLLASGDTGFSSAKTYDLEVFAPGVGTWLEVSSCSTCTDFQARRANIRYRPAGGEKPRFIHTLNGSGLALPRTIAAILEHYQNPDGTVTIPEALRPYYGADRIS